MEENKPQQVPAIVQPAQTAPTLSPETLEKLASREADIRNSGVIDVFEQYLPPIPKDYVFRPKNADFVKDAMEVGFDLIGGIPALAQWGKQNPNEFFKLWIRMMPEVNKAAGSGPAVVNIINSVPVSPLDSGLYGDVTDIEDDDDE